MDKDVLNIRRIYMYISQNVNMSFQSISLFGGNAFFCLFFSFGIVRQNYIE